MLRGLMSRPQDRPLPEPGWPSRQAPRAGGRAGRVPPPESAERLLAVTKGRHKVAPWSKLCRGDPAGAHSSHLVPASSVLAQGLPGLCGTRRHSWDEDQSPRSCQAFGKLPLGHFDAQPSRGRRPRTGDTAPPLGCPRRAHRQQQQLGWSGSARCSGENHSFTRQSFTQRISPSPAMLCARHDAGTETGLSH